MICFPQAVTIDKGADSKRDEVYGWKASSRNLKPLEQLNGTKSSRNQHTNTTHGTQHNTAQRSINVRSVRSRQHRPTGSLGVQQRTGAVHITLTLHKSYTQFPVGTSKERSSRDSWRACRCDVAEGTKVPHDGPAEVPVRFDAGRHESVARVLASWRHDQERNHQCYCLECTLQSCDVQHVVVMRSCVRMHGMLEEVPVHTYHA
jgi:hypothetical protein